MSELSTLKQIDQLAEICDEYAQRLGLTIIIRQHATDDKSFKEANATGRFVSCFSKGVHWLTQRFSENVNITFFKDRPQAVPDEYEFPTLTEDTPHVLDELEHYVR